MITLQCLLSIHWPMCVGKKHTKTVFQFIHYVLWPSVQQGSISLFEDSKCQYWPTSFDVSSTFFYLIPFRFMWSNVFYFVKLRILTYTFECILDKTRYVNTLMDMRGVFYPTNFAFYMQNYDLKTLKHEAC